MTIYTTFQRLLSVPDQFMLTKSEYQMSLMSRSGKPFGGS